MIFASRRGQSIIEALVALTILTVGLMGVLALLSRSLFLQRQTADAAKASYLASEGIEVAKSLIDNGVYQGVANGNETGGWAGTATNCFELSGPYYYYLDFESYSCQQVSQSPETSQFQWDPLYLGAGPDGTPRYYDESDPNRPANAVLTPFSRSVEIVRPDTNTIDVISTVKWSSGSIAGQSVTVEDVFYNWHP